MNTLAGEADEPIAGSRPQSGRRRFWFVPIVVLVAVAGAWPVAMQVALWRGEACIESRRHERALAWLRAAQWLRADRAEVHFLLARCYRRLEKFDEVNSHLRQAFELGWDVDQLEREQWLALAQTGQYDAVNPHWAALFENPGSDGPEISKAFVTGALALLHLRDARRVLDAWESDFPNDPEPHAMRGRLAENDFHWTEAIEQYRLALERGPDRTDARSGLARALMTLGEYQEAEDHLRRVLQQAPDDVDTRLLYGQCLTKQDRVDEARQCLQEILKEQPDHVDTLLELGNLELVAARPADALGHLQRAARLRPENRNLIYAYVKALRATGRGKEALPYARFVEEATPIVNQLPRLIKSLLTRPDDLDLRYQVAAVTWKYKSHDEGVTWFRSVLKMDPTHRPTHAVLAAHYRLAGDQERAAYHQRIAGTVDGEKLTSAEQLRALIAARPATERPAVQGPGASKKGESR